MKRPLLVAVTALAMAVPISCFGQIRVARFAQGKMPANCEQAAQIARGIINRYPHPDKWTFIVVCDRDSWDTVAKANHLQDPGTVYGITLPLAHATFLRGPKLINYLPGDPSAVHLVAHELAHIMLNSPDDVRVDRVAHEWMAQRNDFDSLSN